MMNLLSKSDVFAENKLFATLDTTVRKVIIENLPFLLSDTVGFIRDLPSQLITAFKATLDELQYAVLDAAYVFYHGFLMHEVASGAYPPYKAYGMAYIRFAREEKQLFKVLFMCDRKGQPLRKTVMRIPGPS